MLEDDLVFFNAPTNRNLNTLANQLASGCNVLFVTGAGLSVASGISTYRSEKGSVWNVSVL
jgi:NAD-dependent SIR2 family protein deacetylase